MILRLMRNDYTEKKTLNSEIYLGKCFISYYNAELESEVPVCKSKRLFQITLASVNSGYQGKEEKSRTYNSKVEVTIPKRNLQNQID